MTLTVAQLDQLAGLRVEKRLRLTTHVGRQGFVHLDHDPDALVAELIRLARVGAMAESWAVTWPDAAVSEMLDPKRICP